MDEEGLVPDQGDGISKDARGDVKDAGAESRTDTNGSTGRAVPTSDGAQATERSTERAPEHEHIEGGGHPRPETPNLEKQPVHGRPSPLTNKGVDRGVIIGQGFRNVAIWAACFLLICAALWVVFWLISMVWVGIFPIILALIACTVLWPPVGWLRSKGWPPALAVITVMVTAFAAFVGVFVAMAPTVISEGQELGEQASEGIDQIQEWLAGPPVNLDETQLQEGLDQAVTWIQDQASDIASGVFTGISVAASATVAFLLTLVLTFFFLKDGPRFLPWVRSVSGRTAGRHLTEVLTRQWRTLGGFIRVQAVVSFVDAFFIGLGLWILDVPLWFVLAVLTFFAGFIPIVGAISAGSLAVLVALVAHDWQTALMVLALIILVQQLEGNLLQPVLQGRSMELHAGIILLAVAAGGTLFGIPGAFLAVPVAATTVVALRYISEQTDLRAGDLTADQVPVATPEGAMVTASAERAAQRHRDEQRTHTNVEAFTPGPAPSQDAGENPVNRVKRLWRRARREVAQRREGDKDTTE